MSAKKNLTKRKILSFSQFLCLKHSKMSGKIKENQGKLLEKQNYVFSRLNEVNDFL